MCGPKLPPALLSTKSENRLMEENAAVTVQPSPVGAAPDRLSAYLRLNRVFLRTLVISLTVCTLVAVGALLLGTFNETTAKVLTTLGALAVHSGAAMFCAGTLEHRRWPKLSAVGLILFAASFCVLITCIWWPGWFDESTIRAILTFGTLAGFYILAIPSADLWERRTRRVLAGAGLLVCAAAFLMVLACIWATDSRNVEFAKATGIASVIAFSVAHTALLVRVPAGRGADWLLMVALGCVWLLAAMASASIAWEIDEEFWYRWLGAVGVLDACSSFALLIMAKLRQVGKVENLQSAAARVELRCPRCTALQTVDAGVAKCSACGLKFRIEIEEPRCAKCDYLLWQLPERRCPECGTEF